MDNMEDVDVVSTLMGVMIHLNITLKNNLSNISPELESSIGAFLNAATAYINTRINEQVSKLI